MNDLVKTCSVCKQEKWDKFLQFHKNKNTKDGLSSQCKECALLKRVKHYHANREASIQSTLRSRKKNIKKVLEYNKQYAKDHPDKVKQWQKNIAIEKKLLWGARRRSKLRGLPCTISEKDIFVPENCPVLGIPLIKSEGKCGDQSPTLDCVIPALGYVPGNIEVISFRANTIKSNATADEILRVGNWLKSKTSEVPSSPPPSPPNRLRP